MFTPNALSMLLKHSGEPEEYKLRVVVDGIPFMVEFVGFTGHDKGIIVRDGEGKVVWLNSLNITAAYVIPNPDHA